MPRRNNAVGVKGRSGRKSKKEEFKMLVEEMSAEALVKLANSVVGRKLKELKDIKYLSVGAVKDVAIPITLKGITEKIDLTSKGKKIEGINYIIPKDDSKHSANNKTA